jgi:NAD(P)-dependent dehydrogenase (short-subunit alcohol dehydrogenase family)
MSELRFDDRVAVITGAARGLGRSYALLLASRGAKVIVNDAGGGLGGEGGDPRPAVDVVREIRAAGGEATACTNSVATPEGGRAIVDMAVKCYGRIDILIHNAGITRRASIRNMTNEQFDAVLDVHLRGAFFVVQPAFAHMCDAGYGRIVLTSSIAGLYGEPTVLNYSVAKAGMIGLCNALALDGADKGVKCNSILPSAVTRMAEGRDTSTYPPLGPELVAPAVGWLVHESCTVSGEMLIALAGRMARAYVVETPGVFRDKWTIEQVAAEIEEIRHGGEPLVLPVVPSGFNDHLKYSFAMARAGHRS